MQGSWKRVCRKAHLYLKISHDKTPSALPRRHSICGKRSRIYEEAVTVQTSVPQAHLYLKISHDKTTVCSAEAPQYMRQAKRSRIYEEAGTMQTCLQSGRILGNRCAARHTYISKYHMTRHRLLCRGATVYAASEAMPNICQEIDNISIYSPIRFFKSMRSCKIRTTSTAHSETNR